MKMRALCLCILALITSSKAFGQDYSSSLSSSGSKSLILYDPLFWKDQLKLSSIQQRLIGKINIEFYENIKTAHTIYNGKQASQEIELADLLISRSDQIWETFRDRQKRKWEKLEIVNMHMDSSEQAQSVF